MKEVFLVSAENRHKAEMALKIDDAVSRGSITIKEASSLDIDEDGYFIIIDATADTMKIAEHIMKDMGKKYKNAKEVIRRVEEQEEAAALGFGNIIG